MKTLPIHILLICTCLFMPSAQATVKHHEHKIESFADPSSDAGRAFIDGNYAKAASLYRPLAEQGDVSAQIILGSLYDVGLGVSQDYREAARWYRQAAEQGYAVAQSKLGSMYDIGLGVTQDGKEAVKWWRLAAENGDAVAQLNLGASYDRGKIVPQDPAEAARWYRLAAEQDNVFAQEKLAWKYAMGKGVPQNDMLAYMWFSLAAGELFVPGRHIAARQRDFLAAHMTAEQVARARELLKTCLGKRLKGC